MKRYILYPLFSFLGVIFLVIISGAFLLFFRPDLVLNTKVLSWGLEKSGILKSWSWDKAYMEFSWRAWNDRNFQGRFENFCFQYDSPSLKASSCLDISWNIDVSWKLKEGLKVDYQKPFSVRSDVFRLVSIPQKEPVEKTTPPDIWSYWKLLWSRLVPHLDVKVSKITIDTEKKPLEFSLSLQKDENSLELKALDFTLIADPKKFELMGPDKYEIPGKMKLKRKLHLRNLKLTGYVKESGIPLKFGGNLEGAEIDVKSFIDLPLKSDFASLPFRKDLFLKTDGKVLVKDLKEVIHTYAPEPYDELPAPINAMNGKIEFSLLTRETTRKEFVDLKTKTHINLKGKKQALDVTFFADLPLNVLDFSRGLIQIGIEFSKVTLQLPRLSKKSPPPQFFPDGRFKTKKELHKEGKKKTNEIELSLEALEEKALHIRSNLLDEPLRLNFDLLVENKKPRGYVKVLPLKTTVFKRPIRVKNILIKFNPPREPLIQGTIRFPLPEYKITLELEGPLSDPRYTFTSSPPLPQNDIYAVLLFGRPMQDLNSDDKAAAQKTNQVLAQGILSLSVLYFLAGSPVEYVGYDPETGRGTAQFGLDSKTSLRVGAGEGGGSTGVRRSLGKGWYLDTSMQRTTDPTSEGARDYGVLLERIIAY